MDHFTKSQEFEERLLNFSENIFKVCKRLNKDRILIPIVDQLVRSATSIGANYCEANNASSKKDFANKIFICKKEANETKYWLRLLGRAETDLVDNIQPLLRECNEFHLIFQKIISTMKNGK